MLLTSGQPDKAQIHHNPEMSDSERARRYGTISCDGPSRLRVATFTTLRFLYKAGDSGIASGGRFRVAWRWPFDWHELQTEEAAAAGHMTVRVLGASGGSNNSSVAIAREHTWNFDPWNHFTEVVVDEGRLEPGDRIELICGDQSQGSPGWRSPTFACKAARFLVAVNLDGGDRDWYELNELPGIAVEPGEPMALEVVAPSLCIAGEHFELLTKALDAWGNPTALRGETELSLAPALDSWSHQSVVESNPPVRLHQTKIDTAGIFRVCARAAGAAGDELLATSNPITIEAQAPDGRRLFWGDIHSGQTEVGCGAGSLADHYLYARYAAGLQFTTQQSNDHYVTTHTWQQIHRDTQEAHEDGAFVTFLGCEWSPLTPVGGDRNVIYRDFEQDLHRSGRFFTEREPDPVTDLPTAPEFHEMMRERSVLVNMHVGGRPTNLDFHEPKIEPLAEIHSTHGTSEWFVEDALNRGYVVGITAGTDGVTGRPGADHPGWRQCRNLHNGLTGLYAEALTREAVWEALSARRCYATSGARIRLWMEADGHSMGESYESVEPPTLKASVDGTAAIERIDVLRGSEVVSRYAFAEPGPVERIRILWSGTETLGTARQQTVRWDGRLEMTDGSILALRHVGDQAADDEFMVESGRSVSWRTATAGNRAGIVVEVEGQEGTEFQFRSEQCEFAFTLRQAREGVVQQAGEYHKQVEVSTAPREDGPSHAEITWNEREDVWGTQPYWVRVTQIDQQVAWSSPVYVTRDQSE